VTNPTTAKRDQRKPRNPDPTSLTIHQVGQLARIMNVSASSIHRDVDKGDIPHIRHGKLKLIPMWWVDEFKARTAKR